MKGKESEKRDKYLDLARELNKMWNIRVIVIPIVIGAPETAPKGLESGMKELEIKGRLGTIQTLAM